MVCTPRTLPALLMATFLFTACSGSGGSSSADGPANSALTGVFGFIPVQGLAYSTATQSGITNENGEFNYQAGEEVQFQLGDLVLGQAIGASNINEFDLAEVSDVPQNYLQWSAYYETRSARSPLTKGVNIASVLQSFDTDNDLTNHIQISGEVGALVEADHIDLQQPYWLLRNDRRLRKLLYRASSFAGLTPRPLRTGSFVLQHIFDFTVEGFQTYQDDDGADGTIDRIETHEFAAAGYRAVSTTDNDADGIIDSRRESERNANNQRSAYRSDNNNDGVIDYGWTDTFDEFGMIVRHEVIGPGGALRSWREQTWDDEGALTRRENWSEDNHTVETWQFEEGILIGYEKDSDADGTIDVRQVYEGADQHSDWRRVYIDEDLDGTFDRAEFRTYNRVGQTTQIAVDNDNDGVMDLTTDFTLNARGDVVEEVRTNAAGEIVRRNTWELGADGTRLGRTRDDNGDGALDWSARYVLTGDRFETHFDSDGDGEPNSSNFYTRNEHGATIRYEGDGDADGVIDSITTYHYEGLRRVRTESDQDADGVIDRIGYFQDWLSLPVTAYL